MRKKVPDLELLGRIAGEHGMTMQWQPTDRDPQGPVYRKQIAIATAVEGRC